MGIRKGLRTISTVGGVMLVALCWAIPAGADNINPAGWYASNAPRSLFAKWEFDNGLPNWTSWADDWGWVPSADPLYGNGLYQPAVLVIGSGGGTHTMLGFQLPNFVDVMPLKKMRIQVTFTPGSGTLAPWIEGVTGLETTAEGDPCSSEDCVGMQTGGVSAYQRPDSDSWYFYEDWEIAPNPWMEQVTLVVPDGISIGQVYIETISTPVPPAVWLLGSALLGLFAVGRRKGRTED